MEQLRIAVVGPGLIGKKHIELIKDSCTAKLQCIVGPESLENVKIAGKYQAPLYLSVAECIANEGLDGVIISSPNQFHFEQASLCISAGIPVLIEKPVTVDSKEGEKLLSEVQKNNAKVLVGHHRTYSPLLETAREAIHNGRLGRIVSIIGSAQFYKPNQYFKDGPWRALPGGGPILINMIHEIGNLRTLMGEISSVQAIASSNIRNLPVEDTVAINIEFENGSLGVFLLSDTAASPMSWEQTSRENPSYPTHEDENCYFISGTKGSLSFPTMRLKYFPDTTEPSWWNHFNEEILSTTPIDPLKRQFNHFINVIKGIEKPRVTAEDGVRNLIITEAIKTSAEQKTVVKIKM